VPSPEAEQTVPSARGPSIAEHVILALIAEKPAHGFAVARLVGEQGPVGRIYEIPRPVVYRSLSRLIDLGLVKPQGVEQGIGPQRTVMGITRAGRREVDSWLARPVEHVRDLRTELLVKLALIDRIGADSTPLVEAQRLVLQPIVAALTVQKSRGRGFDRTIIAWRYQSARAAIRFLDDLQRVRRSTAGDAP
jgi:PadR family transcriptional regulator AphA